MLRKSLPFLIPVMGLLYIFAIPSDPEPVKLFFKVIPMLLIICYACLIVRSSGLREHRLLLLGLLLCTVGDGTLRWFVVGLSAFLIGHLLYASYFLRQRRMTRAKLLVLLPLLAYAAYIAYRLVQGLLDSDDGYLIAPVLFYVLAIFFMSVTAIMNGNRFAISGALLFLLSDSILSWNMFVSDVRFAGPLIMLTYYSAQWLIASSVRTADKITQASERQFPSFQ